MSRENLISAAEFCTNHDIEISFIGSLHDNGLIELITIEETEYFDENQLVQLEKMVRLYYDLGINLAGIETINYLLDRINTMHDEIVYLTNRLRLYETTGESDLF